MFCYVGTLRSWNIEDGDLFYALRRPKEQPQVMEFVSLPELDHNIGKILTLYIYMMELNQVRKLL